MPVASLCAKVSPDNAKDMSRNGRKITKYSSIARAGDQLFFSQDNKVSEPQPIGQ